MLLTLPRRQLLALAAAAAASALPGMVRAQAYPARPAKIIVPFAAGSGTDFVARIIAEELGQELGGSFLVENRPGASGTIGADFVAKAPGDGYTLLFGGSSTHSSAPSLFKKLPYDTERDFTPIANLVETPFLIIVRPESPLKTIADLDRWLQANQNSPAAAFAYGSPTTQIAGSALVKRLHRQATAIPYKSNPQALTDLLGGQVAFMFIDQTLAMPQLKAGKVRALAVAGDQRLSDAPEVPTMTEAGVSNFVVQSWVGLLAPAGLPADVHERIVAALRKTMQKPAVLQKLAISGRPVPPTPQDALVAYLKVQRTAWAEKVRDAGVEPE